MIILPSGPIIIDYKENFDYRGSFFELYRKKNFPDIDFVQDNISVSHKNVLRGLHFQKPPFEQGKLITVLQGRVIDVWLDIRPESPFFGQANSYELSSLKRQSLFIPPGFAHGFISLTDNTIFHYKVTKYFNKESEAGIRWDDISVFSLWKSSFPNISKKDLELPFLHEIKSELFKIVWET